MKRIVNKTLNREDIVNTIIEWLKERDILDLLITRSKRYNSFDGLCSYILKRDNGYDLINTSMTWAETPEGHLFWEDYCDAFNTFWKKTINPKLPKKSIFSYYG